MTNIHYCIPLSLPTLRLTRAALKRRFTWNCSPQCTRFTLLVSVVVTKHRCLTVVNRCGALCCPDFPLRMRLKHVCFSFPAQRQTDLLVLLADLHPLVSGVRESNPPPRLGKPMHYRCANTAISKIACKGTTFFLYMQILLHFCYFRMLLCGSGI